MATKVTVDEAIHVRHEGKMLRIGPGWSVFVPTVRMDKEDAAVLAKTYITEGMHYVEASQKVTELVMQVWSAKWLSGVKDSVKRYAKVYADQFPEHLRYISGLAWDLEGFDPEVVALYYVPHDNTGRAGKPGLLDAIREMGERQHV